MEEVKNETWVFCVASLDSGGGLGGTYTEPWGWKQPDLRIQPPRTPDPIATLASGAFLSGSSSATSFEPPPFIRYAAEFPQRTVRQEAQVRIRIADGPESVQEQQYRVERVVLTGSDGYPVQVYTREVDPRGFLRYESLADQEEERSFYNSDPPLCFRKQSGPKASVLQTGLPSRAIVERLESSGYRLTGQMTFPTPEPDLLMLPVRGEVPSWIQRWERVEEVPDGGRRVWVLGVDPAGWVVYALGRSEMKGQARWTEYEEIRGPVMVEERRETLRLSVETEQRCQRIGWITSR
ncbi:hypothetical protein [Thermoflexus hugenholtzii]|nr:hypothetical protein [Thermoflexus hugenholtzii]